MASETIALVDKLVKAKIPKETATDLVDYIDKHQSEKINFKLNIILWAIGILFTLVIYLHSEMNGRVDKLENKIEKIYQLLIKQNK